MKLVKARVQNYRSIRDTGEFDVETDKTIMVGPNEAGKTAVLQALQQINRPDDISGFDELRDYPRALLNDITTGKISAGDVPVVTGTFKLEDTDKNDLPDGYKNCLYQITRYLDGKYSQRILEAPQNPAYKDISKDLTRLAAHLDSRFSSEDEDEKKPSEKLKEITENWNDNTPIVSVRSKKLDPWLEEAVVLVDEDNEKEEKRLDDLKAKIAIPQTRISVAQKLYKKLPVFILYSNYFRVKPTIHLEHLANRLDSGVLDDEYYDYGNSCLLKLLGFTARELSDLGKAPEPNPNDGDAIKEYRDQLDSRTYKLNAASVRLTDEIRSIWNPDPDKQEADKLRVQADQQYLKVVVEDDLGVEVELDQRSDGFQWLVSFFVVFFAEAADEHENAILLLDEPGMSLHALKQREFRNTISRLSESNQTLYTTHSPFLVGPDELDLVRVVEMKDRREGTKVHTSITSQDPAALLPLQEALGYDLAQSLFTQSKNLILEGLTDYWYIEAVSEMLNEDKTITLDPKIALIPANSAGKVVYFATILHAHNLKVAALLDSDNAGDTAANQEVLVHKLGHKKILRTSDFLTSDVKKPEIEDLLRDTLISVASDDLGWDVSSVASSQPERPLVDIFTAEIKDFSKYKLAKAFLRWARNHEATDLTDNEKEQFTKLIETVNKALK